MTRTLFYGQNSEFCTIVTLHFGQNAILAQNSAQWSTLCTMIRTLHFGQNSLIFDQNSALCVRPLHFGQNSALLSELCTTVQV